MYILFLSVPGCKLCKQPYERYKLESSVWSQSVRAGMMCMYSLFIGRPFFDTMQKYADYEYSYRQNM